MPGNLPRLTSTADLVEVQDTAFTIDALGRYICSTWSEATTNGGVAFDAVVIGAGMFGAYCAEKIYRGANVRVLVLDAGPFLVSEHVQNLAHIGLRSADAARVPSNAADPGTRDRVWGVPWRSHVPFPGLAYCLGGRSLWWGGWAPRLTTDDLAQWPPEVASDLQSATQRDDQYERTELETGVKERDRATGEPHLATDYISGALYEALSARVRTAARSVPSMTSRGVEDAPLAVQAAAPASGLFSFDKFSSAPILVDALREAAGAPDWRRRLFLVPRAHVVRLHTTDRAVTRIEVDVEGKREFLDVSPSCAVILACGTIESTRLAMESFATPLMGRNLMGHLRSNIVVRIKRAAFDRPLPTRLEAAALLVRGATPEGRYHLQLTAAAVDGSDSEATMFRMVPDVDLLDQMLASQEADRIVLTLRGIGEMRGSRDPDIPKATGFAPSWMDLSPDQRDEFGMRRAWVNLVPSEEDLRLWRAMDDSAIKLAQLIAGRPDNIEYYYNKNGSLNAHGKAWHAEPPPPSTSYDRDDPANKVRDGLGTTHHEAGTLWMGTDPATSVTNTDGRFHHRANVYVAGPAIFPTVGSANPSLTGLTLARRTALVVTQRSLAVEPGFRTLGNGGLQGWRMAGHGSFMELGANIIESIGGPGILWFAAEEFDDFTLRVDWRASDRMDNSGIFVRIPALGRSDPANDWRPAVEQGYEVQIDERGYDPGTNREDSALHRTGAVYALAPATEFASHPVGEWNTFLIEVRGHVITVTLNNRQVSRYEGDGTRPRRGHIGLQNHHEGSRVQFRNLCVSTAGVAVPPGAMPMLREEAPRTRAGVSREAPSLADQLASPPPASGRGSSRKRDDASGHAT